MFQGLQTSSAGGSGQHIPYSTFLAPCALNFFRVAANFLIFFFEAHILTGYYILKETNLKIKHQRKAAYKQLFSDALP